MFEAEVGFIELSALRLIQKDSMSEYGNFSDRLRQARESVEMSVFQAAQFVNVSPYEFEQLGESKSRWF